MRLLLPAVMFLALACAASAAEPTPEKPEQLNKDAMLQKIAQERLECEKCRTTLDKAIGVWEAQIAPLPAKSDVRIQFDTHGIIISSTGARDLAAPAKARLV